MTFSSWSNELDSCADGYTIDSQYSYIFLIASNNNNILLLSCIYECVTTDRVWISELDLLTTRIHHSELQITITLLMISTLKITPRLLSVFSLVVAW
jgi:hypothetical protein